jgi:hypothetical protein
VAAAGVVQRELMQRRHSRQLRLFPAAAGISRSIGWLAIGVGVDYAGFVLIDAPAHHEAALAPRICRSSEGLCSDVVGCDLLRFSILTYAVANSFCFATLIGINSL